MVRCGAHHTSFPGLALRKSANLKNYRNRFHKKFLFSFKVNTSCCIIKNILTFFLIHMFFHEKIATSIPSPKPVSFVPHLSMIIYDYDYYPAESRMNIV